MPRKKSKAASEAKQPATATAAATADQDATSIVATRLRSRRAKAEEHSSNADPAPTTVKPKRARQPKKPSPAAVDSKAPVTAPKALSRRKTPATKASTLETNVSDSEPLPDRSIDEPKPTAAARAKRTRTRSRPAKSSTLSSPESPQTTAVPPPASTTATTTTTTIAQLTTDAGDESSDDEAPDTVSLHTAKAQVLDQTKSTQEHLIKLKQEAKARRRAKDERLKQNAKSRKQPDATADQPRRSKRNIEASGDNSNDTLSLDVLEDLEKEEEATRARAQTLKRMRDEIPVHTTFDEDALNDIADDDDVDVPYCSKGFKRLRTDKHAPLESDVSQTSATNRVVQGIQVAVLEPKRKLKKSQVESTFTEAARRKREMLQGTAERRKGKRAFHGFGQEGL
ncbi:hypothetical protein H4R34_003012 [Dimargaris verticillata]|uniref:Uncharacterized protein n=1 Tax=Dimargaris verticillata TaxID=2761393 RepID=A0A9W8ECE0_9FUNG|nr:hypothetical protein H4R34_003012 [Dimargaris verticillata]